MYEYVKVWVLKTNLYKLQWHWDAKDKITIECKESQIGTNSYSLMDKDEHENFTYITWSFEVMKKKKKSEDSHSVLEAHIILKRDGKSDLQRKKNTLGLSKI